MMASNKSKSLRMKKLCHIKKQKVMKKQRATPSVELLSMVSQFSAFPDLASMGLH